MIILDPILQTAQDNQVRRPVIKITSKPFGKDIPFDGQLLTQETINEYEQDVIAHSSGRICTIYLFGITEEEKYLVKFVNTDLERVNFFTCYFTCTNGIPKFASMTELEDGKIGVVVLEEDNTTTYLSSFFVIIDEDNIASVSGNKLIDSWLLE